MPKGISRQLLGMFHHLSQSSRAWSATDRLQNARELFGTFRCLQHILKSPVKIFQTDRHTHTHIKTYLRKYDITIVQLREEMMQKVHKNSYLWLSWRLEIPRHISGLQNFIALFENIIENLGGWKVFWKAVCHQAKRKVSSLHEANSGLHYA